MMRLESLQGPTLALLVSVVFAIALLSPVTSVDSDAGIALLVSQTLLDHQTLRLDVYRDDPAFAYDLDSDYRLRQRDGKIYYYAPGVPILSLPFVWVANRFGYHMLDLAAEQALQNLLSALCCAAIFWLLYQACRTVLEPIPSLVITAVSVLGSPLISTVATGLWTADYAAVFLSLAVLLMARYDSNGGSRRELVAMAACLGIAFFTRPSSAFAGMALLISLLGAADRRIGRAAVAILSLGCALIAVSWMGGLRGIPTPLYYLSPARLYPKAPLLEGLAGTLWTPSRGLLVFCPFLLLVIAGAAWWLRSARYHRLIVFSLAWITLHVLGVATRSIWWGGHSYGPRLFTELMPAFVLLTALLWRHFGQPLAMAPRTVIATLYGILGLLAMVIHSYQGLFNPATRAWNESPNVDIYPSTLYDWRYPQFAATRELLDSREIEFQRRTLGTFELGQELAHDTQDALFHAWYGPENSWRWSRGRAPALTVRLGALPEVRLYLLILEAGSLRPQEVTVAVNSVAVGTMVFEDFEPSRQQLSINPSLLRPGAENTIEFQVPDPGGTSEDPRDLGIALRSFQLSPLMTRLGSIDFTQDTYFLEGFSSAESGWRWTDGDTATLAYPMGERPDAPIALKLTAGTLGRQRVLLSFENQPLGELELEGFEPSTRTLVIPPELLSPHSLQHIQLTLPDALTPEGETRRLGLAFIELSLVALDDERAQISFESPPI
ncbi:MAG: glycosyltransferase family 39 protein [Acidobacteriota bacterium]